MTAEEAKSSPYKNVITRSLGNAPSVEVDVFQEELHEGDVFLLCSDGLSGEVDDDELREILTGRSPSEAAMELVERALEHGGRDNVTVLVLAVREIRRQEEEARKGKRKGLGALLSRG
jgi:protein phosphatase